MNRYRVWVATINSENKPELKKGEMITEQDKDHDNIKIDGKIETVRTDRVFDSMADAIKKCKDLEQTINQTK